jgi:hypothetical protein
MYNEYIDVKQYLEEKTVGDFSLKKFSIDNSNRGFRCTIPNGNYISLMEKGSCVMSDTPMEKRTNLEFIEKAHGDVLIAGLGIGLIVLPIQNKEEVKSITILEKNKEVIELVAEKLPFNDKVKVMQGDIFDYKFEKGAKFDVIYFDIWNYVNSDVYEEMKELKKKYRKYLRAKKENPNSFIKCWAEYEAKRNMRLY